MKQIFGIDIGTYSLKGVELKRVKDGKFELAAYGLSPSPVNVSLTESESDLQAMAEAVSEFVRVNSFSNNVVISLPESDLFSFVIEVPKMSEKELTKSLEWEAEQYIPLPLDEVSLDHRILEPIQKNGGGKMEVALIAAPKKAVNKYLQVVEQAGLNPVAVENQANSVLRALTGNESEIPTTLMVCIGATSTDLSVATKGSVRFTRSFPTAGGSLTKAIAEKLNFDMNQSEEYKKSYGLSPKALEGKIRKALNPVFDSIVTEVKRAVAFYNSRYSPSKVERAVFYGGTSTMPYLLPYMADVLEIDVELLDPISSFQIPEKLQEKKKEIHKNSPTLAVAAGAGMKEVD